MKGFNDTQTKKISSRVKVPLSSYESKLWLGLWKERTDFLPPFACGGRERTTEGPFLFYLLSKRTHPSPPRSSTCLTSVVVLTRRVGDTYSGARSTTLSFVPWTGTTLVAPPTPLCRDRLFINTASHSMVLLAFHVSFVKKDLCKTFRVVPNTHSTQNFLYGLREGPFLPCPEDPWDYSSVWQVYYGVLSRLESLGLTSTGVFY